MLVITASDNNYAPGVMVLIASAAFHNPTARFFVLDMGISAENRERIKRLASLLNISINRIEVDEGTLAHLPVMRAHLNCSTYLRFLIPDLFPMEDRVIYMDCDMVVLDRLSFLEEVDLDGKILAAVPCPSPNKRELEATGHVLGTYINAGLMVLNLTTWRQKKFAAACIDYLTIPQQQLLSEDQSVINILAKDYIKLLPSRYNMYSDPSSYKCREDCPQYPAVVHYVVNNKPWIGRANLEELWHFHAERIADLMPKKRTTSMRRRLSRLNVGRKQFFGVLLGRQKYRMRRAMMDYMNQTIAREYLQKVRSGAVL